MKAIQPSYDSTGLAASHEEIPEKTKLSNLIKVLKMLPLNHYVSLEYLVKHLNKIAGHSDQTGMTIKNLAIVWSPNLLRSKELEMQGGIGALQCIAIQAVLTEYLIRFANELFTEESRPFNYFGNQEDDFNDSFRSSSNTHEQSNSFSIRDQTSLNNNQNSLTNQLNVQRKSNQHDEIEIDENHFNDSRLSEHSIESKFPIEQDTKLITLQEAQQRWKNKCNSAINEDKTVDQLISSNFEHHSSKEDGFFGEPCISFTANVLGDDATSRTEDDPPTYGVLGKFGSSRQRKRFGNLDLVDADDDESIDKQTSVRKRRSLFESDQEADNVRNQFGVDRFRYKSFDEQSDDECRSNSSLKLAGKIDQADEPLQRYHTILNPKHFCKTKISTPKESSNLFKRTPTKWKPSN